MGKGKRREEENGRGEDAPIRIGVPPTRDLNESDTTSSGLG